MLLLAKAKQISTTRGSTPHTDLYPLGDSWDAICTLPSMRQQPYFISVVLQSFYSSSFSEDPNIPSGFLAFSEAIFNIECKLFPAPFGRWPPCLWHELVPVTQILPEAQIPPFPGDACLLLRGSFKGQYNILYQEESCIALQESRDGLWPWVRYCSGSPSASPFGRDDNFTWLRTLHSRHNGDSKQHRCVWKKPPLVALGRQQSSSNYIFQVKWIFCLNSARQGCSCLFSRLVDVLFFLFWKLK